MISKNIIQRVVFVKYWSSIWTGFTVDINEKQYLISAKHIFEGLHCEGVIEILQKGEWKTLAVSPIFCGDNNLDLIAFSFWETKITPSDSLDYWSKSSYLSQDVYFLWFPYWLKINDNNWVNNHFPFPFVKKWIISAFDFENEYFFIDAHNNSWFSGWPVVVIKPWTNDMCVAWVVHWFIPDNQTRENSGIAIAYSIDPIIMAIETIFYA